MLSQCTWGNQSLSIDADDDDDEDDDADADDDDDNDGNLRRIVVEWGKCWLWFN